MTEEDFNYWVGLEHSDGTDVYVKDRACFLTELKRRYFKVMRENIGISALELKVKTLEKENEDMRNLNADLTEENNKLLDVINEQDVKIADLEKQIEKMKCCENCKGVCDSDDVAYFCKNNNYKLWEIKEK